MILEIRFFERFTKTINFKLHKHFFGLYERLKFPPHYAIIHKRVRVL
jgi:hypothetical protein